MRISATTFFLQFLPMLLALSGWAKVAIDYVSSRPRIRGRVFQVMRGQTTHPKDAKETITTFVVYLYLLNTRKNSVHVLDYALSVHAAGSWRAVDRVYVARDAKDFQFRASDGSEVKITKFSDNLIYRRKEPVEFGKPLHGWLVFAGPKDLFSSEIARYRVTCIDAYGKQHRFETTRREFVNFGLLQEMADLVIPSGAIGPPQRPLRG